MDIILNDKKLKVFLTQLKPKWKKLHNIKYWWSKNAIDPKKNYMQFFKKKLNIILFNHVLSLRLSQLKFIYIQPD